jgi:XisI protein
MEKLNRYQQIARNLIDNYAKYKPSYGDVELLAICQPDNYLLIGVGWNGYRRVHSTILHLRIVGEKFWVERDETEEGITEDLLALGVPKQDIVLGFHHPEDRKLTEFAIA